MAKDEISDAELDKMIDASIKGGKEEVIPKEKKKELTKTGKQKDRPAKEALKPSNDDTASTKEPKKEQKKAEKPASFKPVEGYDPWDVLSFPHLTEKSMNLVERSNVLVFIVNMKADKAQVKEAVEKGFGVRVVSVRLHITRKNQKKAYVRLAEGALASDIATRLGMI